jgi:hypothetical protein
MELPIPQNTVIAGNKTLDESRKSRLTIIALFLLSPFVALLLAMKRYKAGWAKNVAWFFVVFYGFTFVILSEGFDSSRYRDALVEMHQMDLTLRNFSTLLYSDETRYVDVVQPVTTFIISRFTDNYRVLFAVFGLIFGYFYSRNIWFLIDRAEPYLKKENIVIIITFAFLIGFWSMNGIRMWTAAHIFFFGSVKYLVDSDKKGIAIAAGSILMHYSFMLPVALLIGYYFLQNRIHLYYIFFIGSFFVSEIDIGFVREMMLVVLPEAFHGRVQNYASDAVYDRWSTRESTRNWYISYYRVGLKWFIISMLSIAYFTDLNKIKASGQLFSLLCFTFLFLGVANLAGMIPSGGRFGSVASLFAVAFIFLYFQNIEYPDFTRRLQVIWLPVLAFYCIIALRVGMDTIGILAVLGNPIIALFGNVEMAVIEILK